MHIPQPTSYATKTNPPNIFSAAATRRGSRAQTVRSSVSHILPRKPAVKSTRSPNTSAHLIGALRGKIRVNGNIMSTGQNCPFRIFARNGPKGAGENGQG